MSAAHTDKIILIFCEYKNYSKESNSTIICDILNHSQENFDIEIKQISWSCPDLFFFSKWISKSNPDPTKSQVSCQISNPDSVHAHLSWLDTWFSGWLPSGMPMVSYQTLYGSDSANTPKKAYLAVFLVRITKMLSLCCPGSKSEIGRQTLSPQSEFYTG